MIINKTPHPVIILDDNMDVIARFESTEPIRLKAETQLMGQLYGIPITKTDFGIAENMPELERGTYYIVSQIVKSAYHNRKDLLTPNEVVRDADGNIIGCKSLNQ